MSELLIFFYFFLCVPEPLVNLLLLQIQVRGEFEDLGTLRWASLELLEKTPERLPLIL